MRRKRAIFCSSCLNAQFEGKAAGEVFNGQGKTDILIREGGRNAFIAECKVCARGLRGPPRRSTSC